MLPKGKGKLYTYERHIICLPRHFMTNNDNYIEIPRRKEVLGIKQIDRKNSIYKYGDEIRSVFMGPMKDRDDFPFTILQSSGGDSRCLIKPEVGINNWTAGGITGKNAKVPRVTY